ncbi:MAG: hypothetical protein ACK4IC_02870 [Erythrobacter sp.]
MARPFLVAAGLIAVAMAPTYDQRPLLWQAAEDEQRCMMLLRPAADRVTHDSLAGAYDTPGIVLIMLVSPILPRIGAELHLGAASFAGQRMVRHTGNDTPVVAAMPVPVSALTALAAAEEVESRIKGRRYTRVTLPEHAAISDHLRRCLAEPTSAKPTQVPPPIRFRLPLPRRQVAGLRLPRLSGQ